MNFVTPSFDAGPDPAKAMKVRHRGLPALLNSQLTAILLVNGEPPAVILNEPQLSRLIEDPQHYCEPQVC